MADPMHAVGAVPPITNPRLVQAQMAGRQTSTLLSALPGANRSAFELLTPPTPAPSQGAGATGTATARAGAAQPGAARPAPARPDAALLEAQQAGQQTATLLSSLAAPTSSTWGAGWSSWTNAAATMRTAQEILMDVGSLPPSAETFRIANQAYMMETQAQRNMQSQAAPGPGGTHQWFA